MRRRASTPPTAPIEIAKSRDRDDVDPGFPEELDEDEEAVPDVVPVLLLVCNVGEIVVKEVKIAIGEVEERAVDGASEGLRTSKLNHITYKLVFSLFPKDGQLT